MTRKRANVIAWGIVCIVFLAVAVLLRRTLAGSGADGGNDEGDGGASPFIVDADTIQVADDSLGAAGIDVQPVTTRDVPKTLTLTARSGLNMDNVTHVSALFGGKVTDIKAELGESVLGPDEAGGPTQLCVIESNDLAQAKANWLQSLIQEKIDEQALVRAKELYQANVLAEKFLVDAESQLMKDHSAEEAARQQLLIFGLTDKEIDGIRKEAVIEAASAKPGAAPAARTGKTTEQIRREHMGYVLTAPRSGVIAEKFVAGGETAVPQTVLFTIADTKTLWVWGDVYERDLDQVQKGQKIQVYFTSEPTRARDCTVDWISPVLDPNTHSIKIRGLIDNSDGHLLSDMYGTMIITVSNGKNSLVIPADSVVREDENAFVFVETARNNGKTTFRKTPVQLEPLDVGFGSSMASAAAGSAARNTGEEKSSAQVRVISGLSPNDLIVSTGGVGLYNEMKEQAEMKPMTDDPPPTHSPESSTTAQ